MGRIVTSTLIFAQLNRGTIKSVTLNYTASSLEPTFITFINTIHKFLLSKYFQSSNWNHFYSNVHLVQGIIHVYHMNAKTSQHNILCFKTADSAIKVKLPKWQCSCFHRIHLIKWLADVSTRCSSHHQGGWQAQYENLLYIANHHVYVHVVSMPCTSQLVILGTLSIPCLPSTLTITSIHVFWQNFRKLKGVWMRISEQKS